MNYLEQKRKQWQDAIFSDHKIAKTDKSYPAFHLASPSHVLFDYWGAFIKDGYYHIFYDVCAFSDDNEHSIYGHSRSKDLVHWEYLPLPISPLESELRMNDGFICENGKGEVIMLYTSVPEDSKIPRTHNAAIGTPDLLYFTRIPEGDPFMTLENHGGPDFCNEWSDPWVFEFQNKKYFLMSKCVCKADGSDPLPIYEATDDSMLHWEYKGEFFGHNGEVINFFPMGDKWVLIYSPYSSIEYFVGTIDPETMRFIPEHHEVLSYGYHSQSEPIDRGFYATCVFRETERTVLCGWISGFTDANGWNGCMGVPRELKLNERLQLTQQPIKEIEALRKTALISQKDCNNKEFTYNLSSNTLDISLATNGNTDFTFSLGDDNKTALTLEISRDNFTINGEVYHTSPFSNDNEQKLRILVDKCFCEIFLDDGTVCATRCFDTLNADTTMKITGNENINIKSLEVWEMNHAAPTYHPDIEM